MHTHSGEHTHPEQWAAIYAAAPREQFGVRSLAQGHLSRGIEGGGSNVIHSPHLQFLPARDSNSQPLDYCLIISIIIISIIIIVLQYIMVRCLGFISFHIFPFFFK